MIRTKKARVVRQPSPTAQKMEKVRSLLATAGYHPFRVSRERRRTSFDIIAVKKVGRMYIPLWLYPTRTGRVVVRPWRNRKGASQELYREISDLARKSLRLFRSVPMPKTDSLHEWFTHASRKEVKLLGWEI